MILGGWTVRTFTPVVVLTATTALLCAGCGDQENARPSLPATTAQAQSGKGVLSGVINLANPCGAPATVLLIVQSATNNGIVFQQQYPPGSNYEVQLDPGSYILTVQAPPCVYTDSFAIRATESVIRSPTL